MFDLDKVLKVLKTPTVEKNKLSESRLSSELDLLDRATKVADEGVVPPNASKDTIENIMKKLLEKMKLIKEDSSVAQKEGKKYLGGSGDNLFYVTLSKDDMSGKIIKAVAYDSADEEVKTIDNASDELRPIDIIEQLVSELNLDSVSYALLTELDLLKAEPKKEEVPEPAKEEKPEEKPAEGAPKAEEPPAEEAPKEEKPEESVKEKKEEKQPVKEEVVKTDEKPKAEGELKIDDKNPVKDDAVKTDVKVDDTPVKQDVGAVKNDEKAADPVLNKDGVKKEGDVKLDDPKPETVKQGDSSINKDKNKEGDEKSALNKDNVVPAGKATEGKLPDNPAGEVDQTMIDTLLEKHGLKEKKDGQPTK